MSGGATTALERILRRLALIVGHGRITIGDDSGQAQVQQVQFSDRELQDDIPRVAEYGFTSMPLVGCQALVVFVGGERSNGAIVGTHDERHRMRNLQPGEVAIHDDLGQSVYITRAGIVVDGGGKPITFQNAPSVDFNVTALRHNGTNVGATHTHGGVTAGGASTGTPH
jgi:phage baseplate assembly protein V